jgi:hypothetical protein
VEDVDQVVEAHVVRRLERMTEAGLVVLDGQRDELAELAAERDALLARQEELAEAYAAGGIPVSVLATSTQAIEAQLEGIHRAMVQAQDTHARPSAVLEGMTGPGAAEAWAATEGDLGRRRAILALLCTVELKGAATKRAPFSPDDVVVTWKTPGASL